MASFITYAQNFEDLMLWRALRDVPQGFYIDVGAADPDEHSVTRAFYDRGWRGINIEPVPDYFDALSAARPRDTTLNCLVSAGAGEAVLHCFADTGLGTTDPNIAARHVAAGREARQISVPMRTLAAICRDHAPADIQVPHHALIEAGAITVILAVHFRRVERAAELQEAAIGTPQQIQRAARQLGVAVLGKYAGEDETSKIEHAHQILTAANAAFGDRTVAKGRAHRNAGVRR